MHSFKLLQKDKLRP